MRVVIVFALAGLVLGTSAPYASAVDNNNPQGAFSVVLSPIVNNLETKPGQPVSQKIQVKNQGLSTEHVKTTILKFGAHGEDGLPSILEVDAKDESAKWASVSPATFDAEPNVWKTVNLTISPPKTAAFGYYYAVVFSRDGADKQVQKKAANLLGAAATLVLLDVQSPGAVRRANISEFSTPKRMQEFLPVTFTVRMHNSGNVHVAPRGNIFISKGNKNVALIEVNQAKGNILPSSTRKFTSEWTDGTPVYKLKVVDNKVVVKNNKQIQTLDWSNFNISKLRFGKYNAKLVMVYDDGHGDVSTEARLSFWVMPWRIIAVGGFFLFLIILNLWLLVIRPMRRRKHGPSRGKVNLR